MKRKSPTLFVLIILALTVSGSAECTDSDVTANYPDGMNWYTPGYIICNGIRDDDTCGTGANEGWLTEYYCVGGSRGQASAHCPVGYLCTGGACVQGGSCVIDEDCPNSFPGTMTTYCTSNSACASYVYDYCSSGECHETGPDILCVDCTDSNQVCENGVCVDAVGACEDSDVTASYPDGVNCYTPGHILCNGIRYDDACGTGDKDGWLTEYYCVGDTCSQRSAPCPVGYLCTGGACVQGGGCTPGECVNRRVCLADGTWSTLDSTYYYCPQCPHCGDGVCNCEETTASCSIDGCGSGQCIPGECVDRKICLADATWSAQDSQEYCDNCPHCGDGVCTCGETQASCLADCGSTTLHHWQFVRVCPNGCSADEKTCGGSGPTPPTTTTTISSGCLTLSCSSLNINGVNGLYTIICDGKSYQLNCPSGTSQQMINGQYKICCS